MAAAQYVGTIKSFDFQKGWGHIDCEQTKAIYGKDIFLLKSQCQGSIPVAGDTVYFDVAEGQKGQEASNVQVIASQQEGVYMGTIKSWNPVKKWGHIICDATHAIYGKDIFVMGSAIPSHQCTAGDQVRFQVQDGQKGPEAANVQIVSSQSTPQNGFNGGQTYTGTVRSFDMEKGWGHIICDATRQIYGKDMFVMKSALQGMASLFEGQMVQFNVAMGTKGPECRNVQLAGMGGSVAAQWGAPQQQWPPRGIVVPALNQVYAPAARPPAQQTVLTPQMIQAANGMRHFVGTVKNWNDTKGWGFITCPDAQAIYGKDVFLHKKDLFGQTPFPGAMVTFTVGLDPTDNRPIAASVSLNGGYQAPNMQAARVGPY